MLLLLYRAAAACTAAAAASAAASDHTLAHAVHAAARPFPASAPALKVRLLPLHRAVAACTAAAYTPRLCSAMYAHSADLPSLASASAPKGAHAAAALRACA